MSEGESFLGRWSRRKQEVLRKGAPAADAAPSASHPVQPAPESQALQTPTTPPSEALPEPHDLTPQSDFTPYMRAGVPQALRRDALKQLFRDPHFNQMDMLDVYVDDYSQAAPIPEAVLKSLRAMQWLEEQHARLVAEEKAREENARESATGGIPQVGVETPPPPSSPEAPAT
jgi:hypothetical protein